MDIPQEQMQEVGFFGIYKESFKTIFSWKKIFTQITLTFILPLSFIFLAHFIVVDILDWNINRHEDRIDNSNVKSEHLYRKLSSAWIGYWIFKFIYLTFLLLFSLLSTAAVVYTIAALYSGNEVTFKKVIKIVPKVWKRLALTCLWIYFGFFIYNMVAMFVYRVWETTTTDTTFAIVVLYVLIALYCVGFVYITALWQLASVVSVLEGCYGLKAMMRGNTFDQGAKVVIMVRVLGAILHLCGHLDTVFRVRVARAYWANSGAGVRFSTNEPVPYRLCCANNGLSCL
ncbi:uncharacterized protein LOC143586068 [Bidens hawaiensis]|uniref:uncharacterized protein LOC143586068 n=1 Tax=Bidens hawaiensis TaxID=980011 RepID=UPI004049DF57